MEIWDRLPPHEHPLRLREDATDDNQLTCRICFCFVSGAPFYSCDRCKGFCFHKSCPELPDKIKHPFHPHSLLILRRVMSSRCDTCFQYSEHAPFYTCGSCRNFKMDAKCALLPLGTSGTQGRDWIRHFCHPHPLLLVDPRHRRIKCFVCKKSSSVDLYGCSKCSYFLHQSCPRDLPKEIHLPFHRDHRHTLHLQVRPLFVCRMCEICEKGRYNLAYSCDLCLLSVCLKCAEVAWTSSGSFQYEDHDHLLCLVENVKGTPLLGRCDGYDSYCTQHAVMSSDEFKKTDPFMLWCYQCGFRVHLLCAPLPSMVKHELHIHSLLLVDSMCEDDSGEYYCDVCETERDPLIRLYWCQECKYFAHVHCVVPEIMKILGGDLRDVELKTVGHDLWNVSMEYVETGLTLKDVINKLSEDEKSILRSQYKWDATSSEDGDSVDSNLEDEEIDELLQLSDLTVEEFRSFWLSLHVNYIVELKPSELAMKIVQVKGFMIPRSLAPVLNSLFYELGDMVGLPNWSLWFRSFVLFNICKVVKRMYTTMPMCITKNLLQEWYFDLEFSRAYGFRVDFARAQLEQLTHAFFGFQAQRLEEEIPTILSRKIDELHRKLNQLQWKLDKCKEYRGSSPKSEFFEFCLKKASKFKRNPKAFGGNSFAQKHVKTNIR